MTTVLVPKTRAVVKGIKYVSDRIGLAYVKTKPFTESAHLLFRSVVEKDNEHILQLYLSQDTNEIRVLQLQLQQMQKSPDGHLFAKQLLASLEPSVRYFGALSYTVYIHQYRSLDWTHFEPIVADIQYHVWQQLGDSNANSNWNVIKKLLSSLSLLYIHFYKVYEKPVEMLMGDQQEPMTSERLNQWNHFQSESTYVWQLLFTYLQILAEEITRAETDSHIHKYVQDNISNVIMGLMSSSGDSNASSTSISMNNLNTELKLASFECLNSWIPYVVFAESNSEVRYPDLHSVLDYCLKELHTFDATHLEVSVKAMANLTEILESDPRVVNESYRNRIAQSLFEGFGIDFIKEIIISENRQEYEDEVTAFISLIMAYLDLDILKLARDFLTQKNQAVLGILVELVKIDLGYDDNVSDQLLNFWEDFANVFFDDDDVIQEYHKDHYDRFLHERNNLFATITTIYWSKAVIKPQLYQEYKTEILQFRSQVADFFIVAYNLLGIELYHNLSTSVLNSLTEVKQGNQESVWKLEGSLWLLYKITDDLTFYETGVSKGLQKDVLKLLNGGIIQTVYGLRFSNFNSIVFSTLINFSSSISFVYSLSETSIYLQHILEMLYGFTTDKSFNLSLLASKTLAKVCLGSRTTLIPYLPNFENYTFQMIDDTAMDPLIVQRMVNGYVSIALAVKNPENFGNVTLGLLQKIDAAFKVPATSFADEEAYYEYHTWMPSLVLQIGKASILPSEPEDFYTTEELARVNEYWQKDALQIKAFILRLLGQFSLLDKKLALDASITEKCCQILKVGLNEVVDGPFKFPVSVLFDYLSMKIELCDLNSLSYLYDLVQAIVDSNYKTLSSTELEMVLNKVFLEKATQLVADSDSVQTVVELFGSILERAPSLLIHLPMMKTVVAEFAFPAIKANETLTLRSAMKFWTTMITLRRGTQPDQQRSRQIILEMGPMLVSNLVTGFVKTTRSNLDIFYPVFRTLVAKYQLQMKQWLQVVFMELQLKKVPPAKVDQYVQKLLLTRGQRSCNAILKEFWLEANGLVDYGSG